MNKKILRKALQVYTFPAIPLSVLSTLREAISFRHDNGRWPSKEYMDGWAYGESVTRTAIRAGYFFELLDKFKK